MGQDYWNDFYHSGKVSDYLKYTNSMNSQKEREWGNSKSNPGCRESENNAGKDNGNGIGRSTGW